jgi:prepilin-type processing-associated H-X9-DG protein
MNNEIAGDMEELPGRPGMNIPEADLLLLERAARAISAVRVEVVDGERYVNVYFADGSVTYCWNPLIFSGDAFELAASVELDVMHRVVSGKRVEILPAGGQVTKYFYDGDVVAATRRAVVLSAAEIGQRRPTSAKYVGQN